MYSLFQSCMKRKDIVDAKRVLCLLIDDGHEGITLWNDHLIRLFAECGALNEANRVFCKVVEPSIFTWNAVISAHEKLCEPKMALELYKRMQCDGVLPDMVTYLCILKACGALGEVDQGRLIHEGVVLHGLEADVNVGSTLINMYAKCGDLECARLLFDTLSSRNVVTWGAMMAGYVRNCEGFCALHLFQCMWDEGIKPSVFTFSCALKACSIVGANQEGSLLHHEIMKLRYDTDLVIGSTLISMYSDSGCLEEARKVFNCLPDHDVVAWGIMMSGYVAHGHGLEALELFQKMQGSRVKPSMVIYLCVLQACGIIQGIEKGRFIHHKINEKGMDSNVMIKNMLIDMYAKCGSLNDALHMFECLPQSDIVSWGALIAGFFENGLVLLALQLFNKMVHGGIMPNRAIFLCSLKACSSDSALFWQGRLIHEHIVMNGLDVERVVGNTLVDMYVQFGCLEEARSVFDGIPDVDELSWGVILGGYASNGQGLQAIELFEEMQERGLKPNKVILLLMLKTCSKVCTIRQGRQLHMDVLGNGLETDVVIGSAIVDMYAKCGNLEDACKVFNGFPLKDVVLYGSMIEGYAQWGYGLLALELFVDISDKGLELSKALLLSLLKACSCIKAIGWGFAIRHYCCESSLNCDVEIGSATLDLYAKCGYLEDACQVFGELKDRDLVSWSAIISGCVEAGQDFAAIELYEKMRERGVQPDNQLLLFTLKAYASIGAVGHSRMIHNELVRIGLDYDDIVKSRLCNTYAACGMVEEAFTVLKSSIVAGSIPYGTSSAVLGEGRYAGEIFREMVEGLKPIDSFFSAILAACSHAGMIKQACCYFNAMTQDYGVKPKIQHYSCMVDLLGRAGHLVEAEYFVETAPILPDSVVQISLLTNSKTHTAPELGKRCFLQGGHAAGCISLNASNVLELRSAAIEESRKCLVNNEKSSQRTFIEHNLKVNMSSSGRASQCQRRPNFHSQRVIHTNAANVVAEQILRAMTSIDAREVLDIFACGKGIPFPLFFPLVFNIMSFCRGGTAYLARCDLGQGTAGGPGWRASSPLTPTAPS